MNETEFRAFLNNLETLKPDQFERVFELLWQHFRWSQQETFAALAWRCKQAWMLMKEKNHPTRPSA